MKRVLVVPWSTAATNLDTTLSLRYGERIFYSERFPDRDENESPPMDTIPRTRTWMRVSILSLVVLLLVSQGSAAEDGHCGVRDREEYYGAELEEEFDTARDAVWLSEALFAGPLMRPGSLEERQVLAKRLVQPGRELGHIERVIEDHLYNESDEFEDLVDRLIDRYGAQGGVRRILASIHDTFYSKEASKKRKDLDACLIREGRAHLVVTRVVVAAVTASRRFR
jgi:hypothetical protein